MTALLAKSQGQVKKIIGPETGSTFGRVNPVTGMNAHALLLGDYDRIVSLNLPKIVDVEHLVMKQIQIITGVGLPLTFPCVDKKAC